MLVYQDCTESQVTGKKPQTNVHWQFHENEKGSRKFKYVLYCME